MRKVILLYIFENIFGNKRRQLGFISASVFCFLRQLTLGGTDERIDSHGCLFGKWRNILIVSSDNCRYFFLVQHESESEEKVAQSCPTLCGPMDYTVHEILQATVLEWVTFSFSKDLPNPGIEPRSPALQVDSLPAEPQGRPKQPHNNFLGVNFTVTMEPYK